MICFTLVISFGAMAQDGGVVKGRVVDSLSSEVLSFTNVALYSVGQRKLVTGNVSDDKGEFRIDVPYGKYTAEVNYVGYAPFKSLPFEVNASSGPIDLGSIRLRHSTDILNEVVVQGEKSSMELTLDKRVFNVGQDLANSGGTASDVLMNIPSVNVDPDGGVKLRGSGNVRILIDGKPSGLVSFKGGSGLQQLPASMIERVEIITNPSAKYEAEGLGGVINIILKKEKTEGFNGSIDAIAGHPANYGMAANLNYRHRKVNFFVNFGLAYRDQPGVGSLYQEVYTPGQTAILLQKNTGTIEGLNTNIRGGLDYYFSEKSILTGSYLFRRTDVKRITDIRYNDYINSLSNLVDHVDRRQDEDEIEPNSEYSLNYKRVFEGKSHELQAEIKFLDNWESSDQTFTERFFNPDNSEDPSKGILQRSLNDESEKQYLVQADYVRPFATEGKLETGLRTSFRNMINDYVVTELDDQGVMTPLPGLDNIFYYDENISAVYAILGNKSNKLSYQAGLRAEWTDVKTTLKETNEVNPRKYSNLFPSAHVSYSFNTENSLQVSYSRRVRRPFYNDLSPFMTFSDSRNFFSGNPDLDPEFSNVYEIGFVRHFTIGSLTSSVYYRSTDGKIDNIRTVNDVGFSISQPENLLSEMTTGVDFASTLNITKWWKWDTNLNFFYAEIDGSNIDETYKTTTYTWFGRQTSRFSLPGKLDIQVRTNYEAPQRTAQGKRKALYYADFSVSKEIIKDKGTLNLNVLDVFNTRRMRSTAELEGEFFSDRNFQGRRRQINLSFNLRINQGKNAAKSKRNVTVED